MFQSICGVVEFVVPPIDAETSLRYDVDYGITTLILEQGPGSTLHFVESLLVDRIDRGKVDTGQR